jgi:hypothetical protein
LPQAVIAALQAGVPLALGVDHPSYRHSVAPVAAATRSSLLEDLVSH